MGIEKERILVTGGLGFIGGHVVTKLRKMGYSPDICDLKNGTDIRDLKDLSKYDCIMHLAALRGAPESFEHPEDYFSTNVWGTYNIFENGKKVRKIINISSSSSIMRLSPYGMTKACAEHMAESYDNVITLRPYNVFGEYQLTKAIIPQLIMNAIKNKPPIIHGDGMQTRDFSYVGDVADEIIWHMDNDISPKVHNMGYGTEESVDYVLSKVREYFNWGADTIYKPRRKGDPRRSRSPDRFHFNPVGFEEGLIRTMKWFEANKQVIK